MIEKIQPTLPSRTCCKHRRSLPYHKPKQQDAQTLSYPPPSPNRTANCRPDFCSCGQDIYTGFCPHAWMSHHLFCGLTVALALSSSSKCLGHMKITCRIRKNLWVIARNAVRVHTIVFRILEPDSL